MRVNDETAALRRVSSRLAVHGRRAWSSSNSAVSAALTETLASMTKHSCRAFADLRLTPDTGI